MLNLKKILIPELKYEYFPPAFWLNINLWEFTALEHKFNKVILYSKTGFKRSVERFLVYKKKSESKIIIIFKIYVF